MDHIKQMIDQLADLSDEQITELQTAIVSEFETVEGQEPNQDTVDAMSSLADMLDTVRGESKRREAAAAELAQRATEAAARVHEAGEEEAPVIEVEVEAPEEAKSEDEATEEEKAKPMAEASVDTPEGSELSTEEELVPATEESSEVATEIQTPTAPEVQEEQEAPVTAAADESFEAPADRRPVVQATEAPVAITAGADIPGYTAGSSMNSMSEVAEAMSKRLHGLRRVNGGDGEQHIVASVSTQFPESRVLTQDAEANWSKIQDVVGPEALVASGGHQAPFEVKYDIFGIGSTVRPIRDSLPRFQADRGGIRYIVPPVLSSYANAVGIWSAANDSAETPSPSSKLSLTVTAASETTVATDAVTLQLQFGNLATRAYPELIARHNELGLIQHAREAEGQLLARLTTLSTAVTSGTLIGAGRDYLVSLGKAAAAYRARHRLEANAPLRVIAPFWVKDAMAADLTVSMPGDSTMNAYSEIDGYIASRGINMTWHMDDSNFYGSQSGSAALNEFYDTFVWHIFAEGSFLFLDGGTLDLGIIRDSTLVGTNDYKMFVETFEGIAKVGVESLAVTQTINVNGVAAALRDTTGGATAAAIEF